MRWSSSQLLSPLKSVRVARTSERSRTSERVKASEPAETPRSETFSDRENREKWHQRVKESRDVLEFLESGYPRIGSVRLESLKRSTTDYLTGWDTNHLRPSAECDEILDSLIDEHAGREHLARDVAILACLHALSISAATTHLVSLMGIDVGRYLRCITLGSQANPSVVSGEELRSAQSLLQILSSQGQDFQEFQRLIEILGLGVPAIFIPLPVTQSALERSGIRSHLQRQLDSHLEQKRFRSAFLLVSWLHSVHEIPNNDNIISVLNTHFPSWPLLLAWRPKIERISQWELGKFTDVQREKLSHAFGLDGPDTATRLQESFKMVEPECYEHVHVRPQSTETLERFLDLLYRAHILGPGALELFIHSCIDNSPNETNLSMVDDGVRTGDDSYCSRLFVLLQALSPQPGLSRQISSLIKALPIPNDRNILQNVSLPIGHLADRLKDTMRAAQATFCAQLERGTGEYMGMLIYDLGNAVLQSPWIHPNLPSGLLAQIRQFPPQDTLEAIFDQLLDYTGSPSPGDHRFKSYLASALGGRDATDVGPITLTAIREEVQFWKHPPDGIRKDLSKTLAKIQSIDYSLYTTCLLTMLREDDLYIREMRHTITPESEQTCLNFASYLANRRRLNQLQHECWLLLLASLIKEQGPSFLLRMAESMSSDQWLKLVDDLTHLASPVSSRLPQYGTGLTQETLSRWRVLSQNTAAVRFLVERQGESGSLRWLYFLSPLDRIGDLLDVAGQGQNMIPVHRQIVSYLAPDFNNVAIVCDCIQALRGTSDIGRAVCERILSRKEMPQRWSELELSTVLGAWHQSRSLTQVDKSALDLIGRLLQLPLPRPAGSRPARDRLQSEYGALLDRAKELETLRLRLRRQKPEQISTLLQRLGVDNAGAGRAVDAGVPHELFDAVETVGEAEYELSFALTGLSKLQRQARGISNDSRMLVVRLSLLGSPQFCIHFSPNDEGRGRHKYWRPVNNRKPSSAICTTKPNLFTYYLGRSLNQLLQRGNFSLQSIHSAILKLITSSPAECLVCCGSMGIKLWKPAACSKNCSLELRNAPIEVRLHNLLVDPLAIDLLLCCVYAAAADQSTLKLLPGCPIQMANVRAVIDSLQPLANLQTATDLQAAIRGHDAYGEDRELLLSWLCLKFRGFMLTVPDGFRIPSMPSTRQFLIVNSNHGRERLFNQQPGAQGGSGVVFHSTHASRLFLVLTEGLKVMSGTQFMLNGAVSGPGIYCGNDQASAIPYAGSTGQSWANSALGNMRIVLGCELAAYTPPIYSHAHVITDQNRLAVRYVFLLPPGYQPPPRHHVEPAMMTAFTALRSGLLT
ncbi:MAG: hypothetical protein M1839_007617 [Geoglossum umbratile]|nr:MAG: hypothetical protein M1839_007617 [Geoglossum umbratile]